MSILSKWDRRGLALAKHISGWSKDPSTKVGAVIMKDKRVLGHGYNGFPPKVEDKPEWLSNRKEKYPMVIHAEVNAILNSDLGKLLGSTIYVYPLPVCEECAKFIAATDIEQVICWSPDYPNERWDDEQTKITFLRAGMPYIVYNTI